MIRINVMRTFLNRLRDRRWKNINVKGLTDNDNQVLRRGDETIICVENIIVDVSVDVRPQVIELFRSLVEMIARTNATEIFLPGGGDIPIPDFFEDYCREHGIQVHLVTFDTYGDILNNR